MNWLVAGGRSVFASAPSAIQELVNGNPVQIAASRAALANPAKESTQGYGLTYGVFCSEWIPFQPQSQIVTDGLRRVSDLSEDGSLPDAATSFRD